MHYRACNIQVFLKKSAMFIYTPPEAAWSSWISSILGYAQTTLFIYIFLFGHFSQYMVYRSEGRNCT